MLHVFILMLTFFWQSEKINGKCLNCLIISFICHFNNGIFLSLFELISIMPYKCFDLLTFRLRINLKLAIQVGLETIKYIIRSNNYIIDS